MNDDDDADMRNTLLGLVITFLALALMLALMGY